MAGYITDDRRRDDEGEFKEYGFDAWARFLELQGPRPPLPVLASSRHIVGDYSL
jgi:hypothetical protein